MNQKKHSSWSIINKIQTYHIIGSHINKIQTLHLNYRTNGNFSLDNSLILKIGQEVVQKKKKVRKYLKVLNRKAEGISVDIFVFDAAMATLSFLVLNITLILQLHLMEQDCPCICRWSPV